MNKNPFYPQDIYYYENKMFIIRQVTDEIVCYREYKKVANDGYQIIGYTIRPWKEMLYLLEDKDVPA